MNTTTTLKPATETEINLIRAVSVALLHLPSRAQIAIRANGNTRAGNRTITAEYGPYDVGPLIGANGSMKLAIQTFLAWPFDADTCQFRIETKRVIRPPEPTQVTPNKAPVEAVLKAIREHLSGSKFEYRIETSATAVVAMVEADADVTRELRGALGKLIRGIGRCQGFPALVSLERIESISARNGRAR